MAAIVGVHGIGQQFKGAQLLAREWHPALLDGLAAARCSHESPALAMAFYGDLFRPRGKGSLLPNFDWRDLETDTELALLEALYRGESHEGELDYPTKARTPAVLQQMVLRLLNSPFWRGMAERILIADLKQVAAYLDEPTIRREVIERVVIAVTDDTSLLVGHSLGSVVAFDALHVISRPPAHLVTLGSPLGIPGVVLDKLHPGPIRGRVPPPPGIKSWVNVADSGDIVALAKKLSPIFGDRVVDLPIVNGAKPHSVSPYLTDASTGSAICGALHGW